MPEQERLPRLGLAGPSANIARFAPAVALLMPLQALPQGAGNQLFGEDHVFEVRLHFAMPGYADSLLAYYNDGLEQQLKAGLEVNTLSGTYVFDSVGVRYKGNSSYNLPNKKSMKIDFNEYVPGQKIDGLKKLNLNNCFNDPTFLREKLFFDFSRQQGVLAPRVGFANVYFNDVLVGFYNVVEQVDDEFLDRWIDDQDGNLFKAGDNFGPGGANAADMAWYGTDPVAYWPRYELKTNEEADDWSDLLELIDAINNTTDAEVEAQLAVLTDLQPLLRSLAIDNLFSSLDSYIHSARNWYIYHNFTTDRWQWIKWDGNEAFGRYNGGVGNLQELSPFYQAPNRPLMERIMEVPGLRQQYTDQYCQVVEAFSNTLIDPRIDQLAAMIQPSVFADPNKQYSNAQFTLSLTGNITVPGGQGGPQTVFGLKTFLTARSAYLGGALECASGIMDHTPLDLGAAVVPNPCSRLADLVVSAGAQMNDVQVFNAQGRACNVPRNGQTLDVSDLPEGIYLVRIRSAVRVFTTRLVKQ